MSFPPQRKRIFCIEKPPNISRYYPLGTTLWEVLPKTSAQSSAPSARMAFSGRFLRALLCEIASEVLPVFGGLIRCRPLYFRKTSITLKEWKFLKASRTFGQARLVVHLLLTKTCFVGKRFNRNPCGSETVAIRRFVLGIHQNMWKKATPNWRLKVCWTHGHLIWKDT